MDSNMTGNSNNIMTANNIMTDQTIIMNMIGCPQEDTITAGTIIPLHITTTGIIRLLTPIHIIQPIITQHPFTIPHRYISARRWFTMTGSIPGGRLMSTDMGV